MTDADPRRQRARDKIRFAFTDGLDGIELSEEDYRFVVACFEQALDKSEAALLAFAEAEARRGEP